MSFRKVYVIEGHSGVKVGMSIDPVGRLNALWRSHGAHTIHYATDVRGDAAAIERAAHDLLKAKRVQGEWFDVSAKQAIAAVNEAVAIVEQGRGAPDATGAFILAMPALRVTQRMLNEIDAIRKASGGPTRSHVIRELLSEALAARRARAGEAG